MATCESIICTVKSKVPSLGFATIKVFDGPLMGIPSLSALALGNNSRGVRLIPALVRISSCYRDDSHHPHNTHSDAHYRGQDMSWIVVEPTLCEYV